MVPGGTLLPEAKVTPLATVTLSPRTEPDTVQWALRWQLLAITESLTTAPGSSRVFCQITDDSMVASSPMVQLAPMTTGPVTLALGPIIQFGPINTGPVIWVVGCTELGTSMATSSPTG